MQSSITANSATAFELKGSLFTLTVMHLLQTDIDVFVEQLTRSTQKTPNLFKNMPLVIDLQKVNSADEELDFVSINDHLRTHGLIPVGIRNGSPRQNSAAQTAGFALLSTPSSKTSKTKSSNESGAKTSITNTYLVNKPIRSGQQVYARDANLVVLATVSHGAEILADGHIHVYGNLRGRALAGINGDKTARIFCHKLEAELISIAGFYKLNDSIPEIEALSAQIYLEDDQICISGIAPKNNEE